MTLEYDEIFSRFLGSITDYDFVSLDTQDVYAQMNEFLQKALSKPHVFWLFDKDTYKNDKDVMKITFEMENPIDEYVDKEFITEVLSKGMVIEWLQPKVKSTLLVHQVFGGKEASFYAQANHLNQTRALLEDITLEQRKMIRDRGFIYNPYLEETYEF